ncbi:MAG: hypothetical protein ACTSUD_01115 [Alphaproteobacteria bacterium]
MSSGTGLARGLGLAAILAAAMVTQSAAASGASFEGQLAQAGRTNAYSVANKCTYPIRALVHLVDPVRGWRTHGWVSLQPGQSSKGFATRNRYVYFYAESLDGKTVLNASRDGQRRIRVGEKIYQMGRTNIGPRYRRFTKSFCK